MKKMLFVLIAALFVVACDCAECGRTYYEDDLITFDGNIYVIQNKEHLQTPIKNSLGKNTSAVFHCVDICSGEIHIETDEKFEIFVGKIPCKPIIDLKEL